ncbi:MAG: E3 binding domain-containing protein [Actinomycetota bacterium]|nr:E3 binding domain-containing protein [Actinomycetota bacterium]MDQ3794118.1 E3 binding domain-containing protein [Actinomycetota bacterium]
MDLSGVEGTGQGGRITVGDVQKAAKAKADDA